MSLKNNYRAWAMVVCALLKFHCAPLPPGRQSGEMAATEQNGPASLLTDREVALFEPTKSDLKSLSKYESVEELSLSRKKPFTGDDIVHLKAIPELKVLSFRKAGVTNTGMQELGNLKRLQELTLRWRGRATGRVSISDQGLCHLARLHSMRRLRVFCEGASAVKGSKWIRDLAELKKLEELVLGMSPSLREKHLVDLSQLRQLRHLSISDGHEKVAKSVMGAIGEIKDLESLALFRALVGDEALAALASLKDLESLSLVKCPNITGSGLAYLGHVQSLKSLSLKGSGITDKGIRGLVQFQRLEDLNLSDTSIGPGVAQLKELSQLKRLVLIGCQQLKADHLIPLAALDEIRSIDTSWSGVELTDELRKAFKHKPLVFAASGWPSL